MVKNIKIPPDITYISGGILMFYDKAKFWLHFLDESSKMYLFPFLMEMARSDHAVSKPTWRTQG